MARKFPWTAPICLLGLTLVTNVAAQGIGGEIRGRVRDNSGAPLSAALVELVNTSTGQLRSISTNENGEFESRELPPGSYDLTISKGGFNTAKIVGILLSMTQVSQIGDIVLSVAPVGTETIQQRQANPDLVETNSATVSLAFDGLSIRELPLMSGDPNTLALLAPGVVSVRTFSFANTLVPFAVNGSRGRDNNFIIDSIDNNEPLFGGAATQFTNPDTFSEYRILTGQFKAEYGRNSGSIVNTITQRGGNTWHGTADWRGQRGGWDASNQIERISGLTSPAPSREDSLGATLGGPLRKDSTWSFFSYQWDHTREDLSSLYPQIATVPTLNGLNSLSTLPLTSTLSAFLNDPTVRFLPLQNSPCITFITGLPPANPCSAGSVTVNGAPVEFGTYLVPGGGLFQERDQQFSVRLDHHLTGRDDVSGRYLFDDLRTPLTAGADPLHVGFFDAGLLPAYRELLAQRTQNAGVFWTHAWPRALQELRASFSRVSSRQGALGVPETQQQNLPAVTISDSFAPTSNLQPAFSAAGALITMGLDSRPATINSNLIQVQENFSFFRGRHSFKLGANFVQANTDIANNPSDLGEYFYGFTAPGFQEFVNNTPDFAFQQIPNVNGIGGENLSLRAFEQFYFVEDDLRPTNTLSLNIGLRYENFGQPLNRIAELNPNFGPKRKTDRLDFAPRLGFAWAPSRRTVFRGGYGIDYDPTVFNIPLLIWQSSPASVLVTGVPSNVYPQPPFNPADAVRYVTDCDSLTVSATPTPQTFQSCTAQDTVAANLVQPRVQSFSFGIQHQIANDWIVQVAYSGSRGADLFQRLETNPRGGWQIQSPCPVPPANCASYLPRAIPNQGVVTEITNGANSNYNGLQLSLTKRFTNTSILRGLSMNAAYTWSHMLDNASEIFGPSVLRARNFKALRSNAATVEVITPFPQDSTNPKIGEYGNSSFDRRQHLALSFIWALPSPRGGASRLVVGGWELTGIFQAQTGQPFSALNSFGACTDPAGDGVLTTDRPSVGNPRAPLNSVALIADPQCVNVTPGAFSPTGYLDLAGRPIDPATARFVQVPLGAASGKPFQVGNEMFVAGNSARNSLVGPGLANLDLAVIKNFHLSERSTFQLRLESYDVLNAPNPGLPNGNIYSANIKAAPAVAFGSVLSVPGSAFGGSSPIVTPASVTGVIPENSLDAFAASTRQPLFLSRQFMNTSSRRFQAIVKIIF
jgi:hypothetical protein